MRSSLFPYPIGGKIPMGGALRRIVHRAPAGDKWSYHLDDGTTIHHDAILERIISAARFDLREQVMMGRNGPRMVVHRKWSFKLGTAFYRVADPRRNVASQWLSEERMVAFTTCFQLSPALDIPHGPEQQADQDLQCVM